MLKRSFAAFCLFAATVALLAGALSTPLYGQARNTASRTGDLQIGGEFVIVSSDYDVKKLKGGGVYATFDFTNHLGVEVDIRQGNTAENDHLYERTYEIGARYFRAYGPVVPYAKLMIGRGVFNFPYRTGPPVANLAYNMFAGGLGADFRVKPYLNLRAEYEYQSWRGFPPNGLSPQVISIGAAYHFPGGLKRGKHF